MKREYEKPELELLKIMAEDVICDSSDHEAGDTDLGE